MAEWFNAAGFLKPVTPVVVLASEVRIHPSPQLARGGRIGAFVEGLGVVEERREGQGIGFFEKTETSMLVYCGCGHTLWCEVRPEDTGRVVVVCFDNVETSKSYAEQVGYCPGCGERLLRRE